jgi:molybdenum cofactor cytidylyltransferase
MNIAGIVLAAGAGTRMGHSKLLVPIDGETLLRRAARRALAAGLDPVLVVVGHEAERARAEIDGLGCRAVLNPEHAKGMSTSLSAGIGAVPSESAAAVVLLADMPWVEVDMIRSVALRHAETGAPVVASRYGDALAPPTLFARSLFPELQGGVGEGRGREVVRRHAEAAAFVVWPSAALADLDVPGDLERARARLGRRGGA